MTTMHRLLKLESQVLVFQTNYSFSLNHPLTNQSQKYPKSTSNLNLSLKIPAVALQYPWRKPQGPCVCTENVQVDTCVA